MPPSGLAIRAIMVSDLSNPRFECPMTSNLSLAASQCPSLSRKQASGTTMANPEKKGRIDGFLRFWPMRGAERGAFAGNFLK